MSKIIPLTTEIAIRQHARKIILENIKSSLLREASDAEPTEEEVDAMMEKSSEVLSALGAETLAVGAYLQYFRGENIQLLNDLSGYTTYPVSAKSLYDLYSVMYGIISVDEPDLRYTRAIAAVYGDMNEDLSEFFFNFINPGDPLNWIGWILAIPTLGASLGVTTLMKQGMKGFTKAGLRNLAKGGGRSLAGTGGRESAEKALEKTAKGIGADSAGDEASKRAGKELSGELDKLKHSKKKGPNASWRNKEMIDVLDASEKAALVKFLGKLKPQSLTRGFTRQQLSDLLNSMIKDISADLITDPKKLDEIIDGLNTADILIKIMGTGRQNKKAARLLAEIPEFDGALKGYVKALAKTDLADKTLTTRVMRNWPRSTAVLSFISDPVNALIIRPLGKKMGVNPWKGLAELADARGYERLYSVFKKIGIPKDAYDQSSLTRLIRSAGKDAKTAEANFERLIDAGSTAIADGRQTLFRFNSRADATSMLDDAFDGVDLKKLKDADIDNIIRITGDEVNIDVQKLKDLGYDFEFIEDFGSAGVLNYRNNTGITAVADQFKVLKEPAQLLKDMIVSQKKYATGTFKSVGELVEAAQPAIINSAEKIVLKDAMFNAVTGRMITRPIAREYSKQLANENSDQAGLRNKFAKEEAQIEELEAREREEYNAANELAVVSGKMTRDLSKVEASLDKTRREEKKAQVFQQDDYVELEQKAEMSEAEFYKWWTLTGTLNGYDNMLKNWSNWGDEVERFAKYYTTDWNEEMSNDIDWINFFDMYGMRKAHETPSGYKLTTTAAERDAMVNQLAGALKAAARNANKGEVLKKLESSAGITQTGGRANWKKLLRNAKKHPSVLEFKRKIPEFKKAYQVVEATVSGQLKESITAKNDNGSVYLTEQKLREIVKNSIKKKRINENTKLNKKSLNDKIFENLNALCDGRLKNSTDIKKDINDILQYPSSKAAVYERMKYFMSLYGDAMWAGKLGKAWVPAIGEYEVTGKDYLGVIVQGQPFPGFEQKGGSAKFLPGPHRVFRNGSKEMSVFSRLYSIDAKLFKEGNWSSRDFKAVPPVVLPISDIVGSAGECWMKTTKGSKSLALTNVWNSKPDATNPLGLEGAGHKFKSGRENFSIAPEPWLGLGGPTSTDHGGSKPTWNYAFWFEGEDHPDGAEGDFGDSWYASGYKESLLSNAKKAMETQAARGADGATIDDTKLDKLISDTYKDMPLEKNRLYFICYGVTHQKTQSTPAFEWKQISDKDTMISSIRNSFQFSSSEELVDHMKIERADKSSMNRGNSTRWGIGGGKRSNIERTNLANPAHVVSKEFIMGFADVDVLKNHNLAQLKGVKLEDITSPEKEEDLITTSTDEDKKEKGDKGFDPASKRKEQEEWVDDQFSGENKANIVTDTATRGTLTNIFMYEKGLAFYVYRHNLHKAAEKAAPTFWEGMWTPARGKGNKVNLTLGDVPPEEMKALQIVVTQHALEKKKGIFKNSEYTEHANWSGVEDAVKEGRSWYSSADTTPGIGNALAKIPGLEAYDPSDDDGSKFSAALFFKDLANGSDTPSQGPLGGRKRKTAAEPAVSPSQDPGSGKGSGSKTSRRTFSRANPPKSSGLGSSGSSIGRIIVSSSTNNKLADIISISSMESYMTREAAIVPTYNINANATLELNFNRSTGALQKIKALDYKKLNAVLGTKQKSVSKLFVNNLQKWMKGKVKRSEIKKLPAGLFNGEDKIRVTIKNSNLMRKNTPSIREGKSKINVSRAFMQNSIVSERELKSIVKDAVLHEYSKQQVGDIKYGNYGSSSEPDSKTSDSIEDGIIEGEKFTVKGVSFLSVPSKLGATNAVKLYNTIDGAGDKQPTHPKVKNPDAQKQGLELIKTNIYDKVKPGTGEKYIKRTGTPSESYWSSWYFGAAYNDDPDYHAVRSNGGVGYPAKKGYKKREKVFANPEQYAGKVLYMTFHVKEAPVFPGDAIFHWRSDMAGTPFDKIGDGGPSHMKIMGTDGAFYGGNEPHGLGKPGDLKKSTKGSTAGRTTKYKLDSQRRLAYPNKGDYMAVFKKVKVLGKEQQAVTERATNNKKAD